MAESAIAAHPWGLLAYPVTAAGSTGKTKVLALDASMPNELSRAALSRLVAGERLSPCREAAGLWHLANGNDTLGHPVGDKLLQSVPAA